MLIDECIWAVAVFGIVFASISLIGVLIDRDSTVQSVRLVKGKFAIKTMISLGADEFAACVSTAEELAAWGESFEFHWTMGLVKYFGQVCCLITFAFDVECPLS